MLFPTPTPTPENPRNQKTFSKPHFAPDECILVQLITKDAGLHFNNIIPPFHSSVKYKLLLVSKLFLWTIPLLPGVSYSITRD